jgi:hypothetical protein
MKDDYAERQKRMVEARKVKKKDLRTMLKLLDELWDKAVEGTYPDINAYHVGEVEEISKARNAIATVLGGHARRIKR